MTKIQIIINPASGVGRPVLKILNKTLGEEVEWDISITHKNGDARRYTELALADGADIVAAYGGDGTVTEVANVLAGSTVPLAILPGGTGNSIARILNIPLALEQSAALLQQANQLRAIDLGYINDHSFMLRADIGFTAVMVAETSRSDKDRLGRWAYTLSTVQHHAQFNPIPYQMVLDGQEVEIQGVMCLVVNTGVLAFGHQPLVEGIDPDDGLLDILVLTRKDIMALAEVASSVVFGNLSPLQHWQVKTAVIRTDPTQAMLADGELIENSPAHIRVQPHAINVIVPAAAAPTD